MGSVPKSTKVRNGEGYSPPISPHNETQIPSENCPHPLLYTETADCYFEVWDLLTSFPDIQVLLWLQLEGKETSDTNEIWFSSQLYIISAKEHSPGQGSASFFLDFLKRSMDLALEGQFLLTCLSPVYLPNQKMLKSKVPKGLGVVWQVAGFSGRENLWVKG